MNFKTLQGQLNLAKDAAEQINSQSRIFENILSEAVKGAPESDKKELNNVRLKSMQAIQLAKEGKAEEAQKIIKDLQHGR